MLNVVIPDSKEIIVRQIKALNGLIKNDNTNTPTCYRTITESL